MSWALAASVGINALQGYMQGSVQAAYQRGQQFAANTQALAQRNAEIRQMERAMELQAKQNKAVLKADIQTLVNTNFTAGLLGIQLAQQKRTATQNQSLLRQGESVAVASASANSAAAGTIGPSVDAVTSDIRRKADQGLNQIQDQAEADRFNYETGIRNLYTGYTQGQQMIDDTLPDEFEPIRFIDQPNRVNAGQYVLGAALQVGAQYALDTWRLGLGSRGSPAQAASQGNGSVTVYGIRRT